MKLAKARRKLNNNAVSVPRKSVGYYRNIRGLSHVETELRGANQLLEAIIDASPLAIIALDTQGLVNLWNPAAERMFGWTQEEVLGKPYPIVSEDMRWELLDHMSRLNEGELRSCKETIRQHKDGTLIEVSISIASMLDSAGATIGYVVIIADITERKRAEQALQESAANYRTIFDAANDAIFVVEGEDCKILDVNQKMCEMYEYPHEEALKHNLGELSAGFPPYSQAEVLQHIHRVAFSGQSYLLEWLAKTSSGRLFWIEVNVKGAIIGGRKRVLIVARDIKERKKAEEENRKMQETLLQASKLAAIGTLASGIAHEINNPNNFILSNSHFLSETWPAISRNLKRHIKDKGDFLVCKLPYSEVDSLIPKMINGITEGAHRIKTIVSGLKDFARQEKTELNQKVDVNKVIEAALTMLQNKIKKHTDYFSCSLGENIPPVQGSFRKLEQVIVNLLVNALESLPTKESAIDISTSFIKQLNQVLINVRDEGVGMTEELQKTIFDPFFTTKLDTGGTGLGLSICFTIVKKHNGTIECFSRPGDGTTFMVKIPALKSQQNGDHIL